MLRFISTLVLLTFVVGCASLKDAQRQPVPGASSPMISSSFAPNEDESCSELERVTCPYMNNPFRTPRDVCVERATPRANELKANYMYIDEPNVSIGAFKTSSPIAVLYNCTNLNLK